MKRIIGAQLAGEDLERFEKLSDRRDEGESESQLIRELLLDGIEKREKPLAARLDVSNRVGARIEADKDPGEDDEKVVLRFLREAVDARDRDTLDAIGADEDLRAAVEDAREDGEPLDDTVRRLLRDSAAESEEPDDRGPFAWAVPRLAILGLALTLFIPVFGEATLQALVFGGAVTLVPAATALGDELQRLDNAVDAGREEVAHGASVVAGFLGGMKEQYYEDHPAPASPTTVVERLAWFDVYSYYVAVVAVIISVALRLVYETVGVRTFAETVGPWGVLATLWVVVGVGYLWVSMRLVAILAQLALASARGGVATDSAEMSK